MVNAEAIAMMKPNAIVLNFARDLLVDEEAMVEALAAGKSSVSEESERFIADVSGICSGMGTFIWRTCWLFRFEHRLVFLGRGHDSGQVRVSPCCLQGGSDGSQRGYESHEILRGHRHAWCIR